MADKSSFTPDEWKLLLESVMMASIAITAAEPHGLWGLLQENFAGGAELAKAKMDPGADALIKAVVADFGTADGRSIARDGLKEKFTLDKTFDGQLTQARASSDNPILNAFCRVAPSLRFSVLAIWPACFFFRASAFNVRTCSGVHARRLVAFLAMPRLPILRRARY
jgi:hypothetical protein